MQNLIPNAGWENLYSRTFSAANLSLAAVPAITTTSWSNNDKIFITVGVIVMVISGVVIISSLQKIYEEKRSETIL